MLYNQVIHAIDEYVYMYMYMYMYMYIYTYVNIYAYIDVCSEFQNV
jgi:hypothetical protein